MYDSLVSLNRNHFRKQSKLRQNETHNRYWPFARLLNSKLNFEVKSHIEINQKATQSVLTISRKTENTVRKARGNFENC